MAGIDVVIPAGGELDADFSRVVGTKSKALIKINEKTVLRRTVEELKGSPNVGRVVVVGTQETLDHPDCALADAKVLATGKSGPENIALGLKELAEMNFPPDRVLIVTCDLPFLSSAAIDGFLQLCEEGVDFYVPLVSREDWDSKLPGTDATFVKLHDGEWTTGCVYLATVKGIHVAMPHLEEVFQNRKSKLKMAGQLGTKFVWDYLLRKLTVSDIERKIMDLLNVRGAAVPGSPPELAFDLDYVEDYHYAVSLAKTREAVEEQ
jgi:GTP:adenosylcobinamide-phosphate guanylyltransferase